MGFGIANYLYLRYPNGSLYLYEAGGVYFSTWGELTMCFVSQTTCLGFADSISFVSELSVNDFARGQNLLERCGHLKVDYLCVGK